MSRIAGIMRNRRKIHIFGRERIITEHRDEFYTFGRKKFGPFLFGFVRWLYAELVKKGYDKVFFFSRDGYMMQKAFALVNKKGISSHYVYFSRKSLQQALLWRCEDFEDSLRFLPWKHYISIGDLLCYYGFGSTEREKMAENGGFDLDDAVPYDELKHSRLAERLYRENRERINTASKEQEQLLKAYTEQEDMRGRCAVVDIGWHGNMQYYLEQFAANNNIDLRPEGFYIGIDPTSSLRSPVSGYMYAPGSMEHRKHLLCFLGCFEKLLQSTEGSADGYRQDENGHVLPVLRQYEYENDGDIIGAIKQWQQGALDTVKKLCRSDRNIPDSELTAPLIHFGMYPGMNDVKLFSFFYNTDGRKTWYTAQKPLYRYRPKELLRDLADSPWKTGFLRSVFRLPFPYYLIYRILKK